MPNVKEVEIKSPDVLHNNPSDISQARRTGRTGKSTDVPNPIEISKKDAAGIKAGKDTNPPVDSRLNMADASVEAVRKATKPEDFCKMKPFKLDEINGKSPYRGEGLLPTDVTEGVKVVR